MSILNYTAYDVIVNKFNDLMDLYSIKFIYFLETKMSAYPKPKEKDGINAVIVI